MAQARANIASALLLSEYDLNRKNVEQIKFAKALIECCKWSVQEFADGCNTKT